MKGCRITYNVIKAPHRYVVQEGDATMMTTAASLFGQQKCFLNKLSVIQPLKHLKPGLWGISF